VGYIITSVSLGLHFDTVILIGMVLAFLLNAFFYLSSISKDISLLLTSFVMAASYFTSNHYINLGAENIHMYLIWILYDVVTITLILLFNKISKKPLCIAGKYVIFGLSLNATLCAILHIDLRVIINSEPWWFWYFYSVTINSIDVFMVAALIINRDFLQASYFSRKIKSLIYKKPSSNLV
jgi:hypothetical protein